MSVVPDETAFFCDRCQAEVRPGRGEFYVVRIEAFADPTPPEITEEDLRRDHSREIKALFERLRDFSEQELLDQVYRRVSLILCNRCYADWIEDPAEGGHR
ncbi:MAG TPA: hypothetical protein VML55_23455 [Planctomycetaceae bacterium]|nr:hypothetical protein [Planctomycetaceae bacterium]